jgi:ribonuclease Z
MELRVTVLGTGAGFPAPDRGATAIAVEVGRRVILLDCGEGTQQRLQAAGIPLARVRAIFLSHFHADHCLGLPGLLQTYQLLGRERRLDIYGPEGVREFVHRAVGLAPFAPGYCTISHALAAGDAVTVAGVTVTGAAMDHTAEVLGYRVQAPDRPGTLDVARARALGVADGPDMGRLKAGEAVTAADGSRVDPGTVLGPGRAGASLTYSADTRPNPALTELAAGTDLLIHDATFTAEREGRAAETGHSTAAQAAATARDAGVGRLVLWHFSQRYRDAETHLAEARAVFPASEAAADGSRWELGG